MKAEIKMDGPTGTLSLDGVDISRGVRGFALSYSGGLPELDLSLAIHDGPSTFEGDVSLLIPTYTYEALVAMGWTPPPPS
jgi:hypothetical protein